MNADEFWREINMSVDEIQARILGRMENQPVYDEDGRTVRADTSVGSLLFMHSAGYASELFGQRQRLRFVLREIFPQTASPRGLEMHAGVHEITRRQGESGASLLARLLNHLRRPPAGGNRNDYEQWALTLDRVKAAYCYPLAQGINSVDVVILADEALTGSEVASSHVGISGAADSITEGTLSDSGAEFITAGVAVGDRVLNVSTGEEAYVTSVDSETGLTLDTDIFAEIGQEYELTSLCGLVLEYIDQPDVRPVTSTGVRVLPAEIRYEDVTMSMTGGDLAAAKADISAYLSSFAPQQVLYVSRLAAIAHQDGAEAVDVDVPAANIAPDGYEMIRPGTVTVNAG